MRYHFIIEGQREPVRKFDDPHGTELPNDAAAEAQARRIIRKLKDGGTYDDPKLLMVVANEHGAPIFWIPFDEVAKTGEVH